MNGVINLKLMDFETATDLIHRNNEEIRARMALLEQNQSSSTTLDTSNFVTRDEIVTLQAAVNFDSLDARYLTKAEFEAENSLDETVLTSRVDSDVAAQWKSQ